MTPTSLKSWRLHLKLNKGEAAKALGCSVKAYRQWESGLHIVPHYIGLAASAIAMGLLEWGERLQSCDDDRLPIYRDDGEG